MRYNLGGLVVFMFCFHNIDMMNTPRPRQRIIRFTDDGRTEIYKHSTGQFVEEKPIRPRKTRNQRVEGESASTHVKEEPLPTPSYRTRSVRPEMHNNIRRSNPNIHETPEHMPTFQQDTASYNIGPFTGSQQNNGLHMELNENGLIQFTNQHAGPLQDKYSPGPSQHQGPVYYPDSYNFQANHPNFQNYYPPQSVEGTQILHGYPIKRPDPQKPNHNQPQTNLQFVKETTAELLYKSVELGKYVDCGEIRRRKSIMKKENP